MPQTIIEKIITNHNNGPVHSGDVVDIRIDVRVARDFGGANVVKNLETSGLGVDDPGKTFFTFDCNPTGSDQKYASNQQLCRIFARKHGIQIYDIDHGIGTHIGMDEGLVVPGETLVSTDSHANIIGAIGAFGQGMGDQDIAHAFAFGKVWFQVPPSLKVVLKGRPSPLATPKDVILALNKHFGANGLLGYSAEFYGDFIDSLPLAGRITLASMATEMGAIIALFPPNQNVLDYCTTVSGRNFTPVYADEGAKYDQIVQVDISDLKPMISLPGHPEDVVPVREVMNRKIDSVLIGSCTNGRFEDLEEAARVLKGRMIAPGVVMKIVPSTDRVWREALDAGLIKIFKESGAMVGNAGCAGCAEGQIGQNGPDEVTVSTGNRNFTGKQGKGQVYLASPATAAASAIAGVITSVENIPERPVLFPVPELKMGEPIQGGSKKTDGRTDKPVTISGRVWVIPKDNIDTDMIYHNRYLAITNIDEMGQYTFDNLKGFEDFAKKARRGDIVVTGKNFGAGSSRQQAVDCFKSLGIALLIAESFGAIYERNAINAGMPILKADLIHQNVHADDLIQVNFSTGEIEMGSANRKIQGVKFSDVQMKIYQKGGLLK